MPIFFIDGQEGIKNVGTNVDFGQKLRESSDYVKLLFYTEAETRNTFGGNESHAKTDPIL